MKDTDITLTDMMMERPEKVESSETPKGCEHMKKKILLISLLSVVLVLILGVVFMAKNSMSFSTGVCIAADNGGYLMVIDHSPVSIHRVSGKDRDFPDLDTGDKIFVIHDGIAESYPGRTGVYFILKLSDGDIIDVPAEVISQLRELGRLAG